jgi:hypothetical protein
MRATARSMPNMSEGSWRLSIVGLRKASAERGSAMPRETSREAMAGGQCRCSVRCMTALDSADCIIHCCVPASCGPAKAEDMDWLLVGFAVVDDYTAEIGDCLHEVLETVVPIGGDLEEEHDALVGEAELQVTDLADVIDEVLRVVDLLGDIAGEGLVAELVEEDDDVGLLEDDLAHGEEWSPGRLGVLDEVLPAVRVVLLEDDGGNVLGDEGIETAHAVACDEGHHVVLERDQVVGLHSMAIVSETTVNRTGIGARF